ncbi:phosphatidylglycerol lysyltransferase domain-containing protein [Clostridium sp. CCUG 7971]|uniref:DUF2156 domain-containing protein n=1 Tax=Clostridium sp. CCUG 7971 TaxID=2811414 RepID=UPI001ABB8E38|nr:phosphatidylglycerol lysyltransferase domain-containing protein [Clostridium sp. CCUG 7971]MBO3444602.1 DUF2156 domain-containing protein [Clostridium sp. CCUG 7971]
MFKLIDIESKKIIDKYFDLVDYEACEYCFTTLYMWKDLYNIKYYQEEKFIIISGEYEGKFFFIQPLVCKDNIKYAMHFILNYFKENNKKLILKAITKDFIDYIESEYPNKFNYMEDRDNFDYVYEGESLRTLVGKKNQKKRNHLNYFLKEYDNIEYKALNESNFNECIELLDSWMDNKEIDKELETEKKAIDKIFKNYKYLKDKIKVGGIYIDNKLQAFSIGEMLTDDMALIHIEKANQDIRGLYQYINQQFIVNEFNEAKLINREEDLGIEGLRKAKLSYHPIKFTEKYTITVL